jgi:uncharacterized protein YbjT (DUF2867 family)
MRVAVAGGTGVVGRHVTSVLAERGHEPVVLARSRGVDLLTRAGVDAALEGVQVVVDVSNVTTLRRSAAERFFETTTTTLLEAGRRAGVRHLVVLSIVGIDAVDTGYYAGKRRQEQVALAGGLPLTIVRATQFHEFAEQVMARGGVGRLRLVPRMRVQPVAAHDVAEVLAEHAVGDPAVRAPDVGGPEVHELLDLARAVVTARGHRWRVLPLPVPGAAGRAMASGALLLRAGSRQGPTTFADWLAAPSG